MTSEMLFVVAACMACALVVPIVYGAVRSRKPSALGQERGGIECRGYINVVQDADSEREAADSEREACARGPARFTTGSELTLTIKLTSGQLCAVLNGYENLRSMCDQMQASGPPPKYWEPELIPCQLVANMIDLPLEQIHGAVVVIGEAAGTPVVRDAFLPNAQAGAKS